MKQSDVPLPRQWPKFVRSAVLNVASLAHASITFSRGWYANSPLKCVQLASELNQARQEISLLNEEMRIKDGRSPWPNSSRLNFVF